MANVSKSNIKKKNVTDILTILYTEKYSTKNNIAKKLNLSVVTAHNLINELTDMGICMENGDRVSSGGRNALLYQINPQYGYIVGQSIEIGKIATRVYDISLQLHYENIVENDLASVEATISRSAAEINQALRYPFEGHRFLGVGITIPGRATTGGTVVNIPGYPAFSNVPLVKELEGMIDRVLPIFLDNDNNASALSEKWGGSAYRFQNYIFLSLKDGVGAGVVIDNSLFYGSNYNACEIGHIPLVPDGPVCKCGKRGCIETMASDPAVFDCVAKEFRLTTGENPINWDEIETMVKNDTTGTAVQILRNAARYLPLLIECVVQIFDPKAVIVQSSWLPRFPDIWSEIVSQVFTRCAWLRRDRFSMKLNRSNDTIKSSPACLIMENLYTPSDRNVIFDSSYD